MTDPHARLAEIERELKQLRLQEIEQELAELDGRALNRQPDALRSRLSEPTVSDDGRRAFRTGDDGTLFDANFLMDQRASTEADRLWTKPLSALDRMTTLERNATRRGQYRDAVREADAAMGDWLPDSVTDAIGGAGAATMDLVDTVSGVADLYSGTVSDDIMEALGYEEAAERRRQATEQTLTGGGPGTLAAVGGMLATAPSAAKALSYVPGLRGVGLGAQTVRNVAGATAAQQYHTAGGGNFDSEAIEQINTMDPGQLGALVGAPIETGLEMQYLGPALGLLPTAAPIAGAAGRAGKRALEPITDISGARRADRILAERLQATGLRPDDVEAFKGAGQGEMMLADVDEGLRDLTGSAARNSSGPNADALKARLGVRRDDRVARMREDFAEAIDAPSDVRRATAQDTPNKAVRKRRDKALDDLNKTAEDRGYSRGEGLEFTDAEVPRAQLDPLADRPEGWSWIDEASALRDEFDAEHGGRVRAIQRSEQSGRDVLPRPRIPISDKNFAALNDGQVKMLLRSRGFNVDQHYAGDLSRADADAAGLIGKGVKMDANRRKALLKVVRDRETANPPPKDNRQPPSVQEVQSLKQSIWSKAEAAENAGDTVMARVHKLNFDRVRRVLHEGARDGSGQRAIKVGDAYHGAAQNALKALDVGEAAFKGNDPNRFLDLVEELQNARKAIEADTSFTTAVRKNVLKEFDNAIDALKASSVASYSRFLRTSRVNRDARVFNAGRTTDAGEVVEETLDDVMLDRLNAIFDDAAERDEFLARVNNERAMQLTEREIVPEAQGSATGRRSASDKALSEKIGGDFDMVSSVYGTVNDFVFQLVVKNARRLHGRYVQGMTEKVSEQLIRRLSRTDFDAIANEMRAAQAAGRLPTQANLPPALRARMSAAVVQAQKSQQQIQKARIRFSIGAPEQQRQQIAELEDRIRKDSVILKAYREGQVDLPQLEARKIEERLAERREQLEALRDIQEGFAPPELPERASKLRGETGDLTRVKKLEDGIAKRRAMLSAHKNPNSRLRLSDEKIAELEEGIARREQTLAELREAPADDLTALRALQQRLLQEVKDMEDAGDVDGAVQRKAVLSGVRYAIRDPADADADLIAYAQHLLRQDRDVATKASRRAAEERLPGEMSHRSERLFGRLRNTMEAKKKVNRELSGARRRIAWMEEDAAQSAARERELQAQIRELQKILSRLRRPETGERPPSNSGPPSPPRPMADLWRDVEAIAGEYDEAAYRLKAAEQEAGRRGWSDTPEVTSAQAAVEDIQQRADELYDELNGYLFEDGAQAQTMLNNRVRQYRVRRYSLSDFSSNTDRVAFILARKRIDKVLGPNVDLEEMVDPIYGVGVADMETKGDAVAILLQKGIATVGDLDEEIMHAALALDAMPERMKRAMFNSARNKGWVNKYLSEAERAEYLRLYDGDETALLEEAIAKRFAAGDFNKLEEAIADRILKFIKDLARVFGLVAPDADDVMRRLDRGELRAPN